MERHASVSAGRRSRCGVADGRENGVLGARGAERAGRAAAVRRGSGTAPVGREAKENADDAGPLCRRAGEVGIAEAALLGAPRGGVAGRGREVHHGRRRRGRHLHGDLGAPTPLPSPRFLPLRPGDHLPLPPLRRHRPRHAARSRALTAPGMLGAAGQGAPRGGRIRGGAVRFRGGEVGEDGCVGSGQGGNALCEGGRDRGVVGSGFGGGGDGADGDGRRGGGGAVGRGVVPARICFSVARLSHFSFWHHAVCTSQ